jgi:hypothetical protein
LDEDMMCDVMMMTTNKMADNHHDSQGDTRDDDHHDNVKKRKLDTMSHDNSDVVNDGLRRGKDDDGHHRSEHNCGVDDRDSLNEEAIRLKSSIR